MNIELYPSDMTDAQYLRNVAAYWAVKKLGMAGTEVGDALSSTQPAVSRAVRRDEEIVREFGLSIVDDGNA